MSKTSELILNHRSIRSYTSEVIPEERMDEIIRGAMQAPNSINGQCLSLVQINDPDIKKELIKIASNQTWIGDASHFFIFCMDFYKAGYAGKKHEKTLLMPDQTEAVMLGSLDVGLAMGNAIAIAESYGYGTCPIGAIRNNPREIVKLLKLPEYVYPVAGLVVGVRAEESAVKPRMPKDVFLHQDTYRTDIHKQLDDYDQEMTDYMDKRTGGKSKRNWSETVSTAFSQVKHPDVTPVLKEQGFGLK